MCVCEEGVWLVSWGGPRIGEQKKKQQHHHPRRRKKKGHHPTLAHLYQPLRWILRFWPLKLRVASLFAAFVSVFCCVLLRALLFAVIKHPACLSVLIGLIGSGVRAVFESEWVLGFPPPWLCSPQSTHHSQLPPPWKRWGVWDPFHHRDPVSCSCSVLRKSGFNNSIMSLSFYSFHFYLNILLIEQQ